MTAQEAKAIDHETNKLLPKLQLALRQKLGAATTLPAIESKRSEGKPPLSRQATRAVTESGLKPTQVEEIRKMAADHEKLIKQYVRELEELQEEKVKAIQDSFRKSQQGSDRGLTVQEMMLQRANSNPELTYRTSASLNSRALSKQASLSSAIG